MNVCPSDHTTQLRLFLQFREENFSIDLNYSSFKVKRTFFTFTDAISATAHFQGMDHKSHFRFSRVKVNKPTLANINLSYSCSQLGNIHVLQHQYLEEKLLVNKCMSVNICTEIHWKCKVNCLLW